MYFPPNYSLRHPLVNANNVKITKHSELNLDSNPIKFSGPSKESLRRAKKQLQHRHKQNGYNFPPDKNDIKQRAQGLDDGDASSMSSGYITPVEKRTSSGFQNPVSPWVRGFAKAIGYDRR